MHAQVSPSTSLMAPRRLSSSCASAILTSRPQESFTFCIFFSATLDPPNNMCTFMSTPTLLHAGISPSAFKHPLKQCGYAIEHDTMPSGSYKCRTQTMVDRSHRPPLLRLGRKCITVMQVRCRLLQCTPKRNMRQV